MYLRLITLYFSTVGKHVVSCKKAVLVFVEHCNQLYIRITCWVKSCIIHCIHVKQCQYFRVWKNIWGSLWPFRQPPQLFPSSGQYHPNNARNYEPPLLKEDSLFRKNLVFFDASFISFLDIRFLKQEYHSPIFIYFF